jgi:hypothetical protein
MRALWNRAAIGWCRAFHPEPLWPVNGHYRCRACLRAYAVSWQEDDALAKGARSGTEPAIGIEALPHLAV